MATNKSTLLDLGKSDGVVASIGRRQLAGVDVKTQMATFHIRSSDGNGQDGPDFQVPIASILPNRDEDSVEFWKMLVDSLMSVLRDEKQFPEFVKGYEVSVGEDWSGDPALYVTILVAPRRSPAKSEVAQWSQFTSLVGRALQEMHLQRWPYVRIGEIEEGR
jgi:hypothetical protein